MRALGFREHGDLGKVELLDLPEPRAGPGEVRVRIRAAAFNRLDLFTLAGIEGVKIPLPHILAGDGAGLVDEVGPGVARFSVGEKVLIDPSIADGTCEYCRRGLEPFCRDYKILGEHVNGTATELVVVPEVNVRRLPERLDFVEGGCCSLVFMTAYRALLVTGALQAGERVAIVGGGGGLNPAALEVARWKGAEVAVATRSADRAEKAQKLGAQRTVVYGPDLPLDRALWGLSDKRGFDLIFDCNGTPTVGLSTRALARGGRLVFCGGTAGSSVTFDVRPLFWRGASLRGSTMATRREYEEVLELLAQGKLRPVVDSIYPLEEGREALARLQSGGTFGKVVLKIG